MITPEDLLNQATQAAIADLTTPLGSVLSAQEREQLAVCETTIATQQRSIYVLGGAIRQVRDSRLYREQFDTIEAYGEVRWDLKRAYLYQHIDAADVGDNLRAVTDVLPLNEFQTRQLAPLTAEVQRQVWLNVIENSKGATITAKMVKAAIATLVPQEDEEADDDDTALALPVLPKGVARTLIVSDITSDVPPVAADQLRDVLSQANLSLAEDCHLLVVCRCSDSHVMANVMQAFDFEVGTHLNWEQPTLRRPFPWSFCRAELQILHARARAACIAYHGTVCVCGFDFEKTYGTIGLGFIHVHHHTPIAERNRVHSVDPKTDMIPLCPNCHAMIHRKKITMTIKKLLSLISSQKSSRHSKRG